MKLTQLFIAALAAAAMSGPASAVILTGTSGSSANIVTDYSAPAQLAFDLDLHNFASTQFTFKLEDSDLLGPLAMNAVIRNLSGGALNQFRFTLAGIAFDSAGSVTPTFGTIGQAGIDGNGALIEFATPEWAEFHFGNPFSAGSKNDWTLNTQGLRAGDLFSITATVPEPSSMMLLVAALAMLGLYGARVRQDR